jgi:hypothetical protein
MGIKSGTFVLSLFILGPILTGCDEVQSNNPVGEFQKYAQKLKEMYQKEGVQCATSSGNVSYPLTGFTYDVQKTNSLVSPYIGIINIEWMSTAPLLDPFPVHSTRTYVYQDNQWVEKKPSVNELHNEIIDQIIGR